MSIFASSLLGSRDLYTPSEGETVQSSGLSGVLSSSKLKRSELIHQLVDYCSDCDRLHKPDIICRLRRHAMLDLCAFVHVEC